MIGSRARAAIAGALVVATTACTDLSLPAGAQVSCASDEECPSGFLCRLEAGRCIDAAVLGKTPIDFEEAPSISPGRIGVNDGFNVATVRATFTEEPVDAPSVSVLDVEVPCEGTRELLCQVDAAAAALPEGTLEVRIVGRDAAANAAEATLPLVVDRTAPAVADAPPALLEAAPDNPIARPQAMAPGTTARVTVALTELLGADPAARLADTDVMLTRLDTDGLADAVVTFAWTFAAGDAVPDGPRLVELSLQDAVGNSATVEVDAGIVVDTAAPAAPAVEQSGAVVYRRAPWGVAGDPAPRFEVIGAPGLEAGLMVEARSDDSPQALVLGRALTGVDGAFTLPLIAVDVPRVHLVSWDPAGNPSAAVRVRDIEWTAGFARKVMGSRLENPHALYAAPHFDGSALGPALESELNPLPLLDASLAPVTIAGGATWSQRRRVVSGAPNRGDAAVAYHTALGRTVVFGGYDTSVFTAADDTFVIEGDVFVPLELSVRPPPGGARMAFDSRRDRLVLHSHGDRSTWVFEEMAWRPLALTDPGTTFDAMAYDPLLDAVIAYSGSDALPATWLLQDDDWQRVDAAEPGRRRGLVMAWDDNEQRVLLHGGEAIEGNTLLGDLWAFDGQQWQALGNGPTLKWHAALTGPEGAMWLVGGSASCDAGNTWSCVESQAVLQWQGAGAGFSTVSVAPASAPPALGAQLGASWEGAAGRLVCFGGGTEQSIAGLVYREVHWVMEDGAWRRVDPSPPPTMGDRTDFPPLLYDSARAGLIAAGGAVVSGAVGIRTDTQLLAGDLATELADDFNAFGFSMVGHFTPLFRSALGDTMITLGRTGYLTGGGWVLSPAATPARTDMAAAFHETRGETILFGGTSTAATNETRRFNGSSYSVVSTATVPPARSRASMSYDPGRDAVLMFGGEDGATQRVDTWAYDGTDWSLLAEAGPTLTTANLLYDRQRELPVLIGTEGSNIAVHELVDGAWRVRAVGGIEGSLRNASAGYDVGRGWITLAGGTEVNGSTDAVYTWDGSPSLRATTVAQIDLRARGAAPDAILERLTVDAVVGARGFVGADAAVGASVQLWRGGWQPLGGNEGSPELPAAMTVGLEDAALLRGLDPARLHVALSSSAGNGSRQAELAVRSLALTLRYREP